MRRAHGFQEFQAGDAGSPGAVQHDFHILNLLAGDFQGVDQARRADHRCAMLVVVKHRDIAQLFQALFDDEALGGLDILKIDAAEGRGHQMDGLDDLVRILGCELDVDGVDVGEAFEQHRLALHHRLGGQRAKVTKAQNRGAVRDDRDHVALDGVVIGKLGIGGDGQHRDGDAGGIGKAQVALRRHRFGGRDDVFARRVFAVIGKRLFGRGFRSGHRGANPDVNPLVIGAGIRAVHPWFQLFPLHGLG